MAEKKVMETKTNFLRIMTTHLIVYQLVTVPSIYAQAGTQSLLMGIPGLIKKVGQDMIQGKKSGQDAFMLTQQQQGDPFRPQTVASKYFPECQVPMAISAIPSNACAGPPAPEDQAGLAELGRWLGLADQYESYFRAHSAENQNTRNAPEGAPAGGASSIGASCLNDAKKRREDQLQSSINEIIEAKNQLESSNEKAKQELQDALSKIQDTAHVLYGGKGGSPDTKGRAFHGLFSPGCQELIGTENLNRAKGMGLSGLKKDILSTPQQMANRFTNPENREGHIEDIRGQINKLKEKIERYGPEAWKPNYQSVLGTGNTEYPSIGKAMERQITNFKSEINRIRTEVKDQVGYILPALDHQFRDKVKKFSKKSVERRFIKTCVSENSSLSTQNILAGLRHPSTGGRGTTLINYRNALRSILESSSSMERKIQEMERLDAQYGRGSIIVGAQNSTGSRSYVPPHVLFREQTDACRGNMNKGAGPMAQTIDRSDQAVKQALKLEQGFASEFFNNLYDEVVNCSEQPVKTGTCNLDKVGSVLSPDGGNFCVAHATECGKRVNACHGATHTLIRVYEGKRDIQAARYNSLALALEKNRKDRLGKMKAKVLALAQEINKQLVGTQIEWPSDLSMEETKEEVVGKWGVKLKGGGDLRFLEEAPRKFDLLIQSLKRQMAAASGEMSDYIQKQKQGWGQEVRRWAELKNKCGQAMSAYQQGMQEQMEAQQEQMDQAQNFCLQYESLSQNPGAGCDSVDQLFEDAMQASALINPEVFGQINEFKYYCNTVNNEALPFDSDSSSSPSDLTPSERFSEICEEKGDDWGKVLEDMKQQAADLIPRHFSEEETQAIADAIQDESKASELGREITRTPFYRTIVRRVHTLEAMEAWRMPSLSEGDLSSDFLKSRLREAHDLMGTSSTDSTIQNFCKVQKYKHRFKAITYCEDADNEKYQDCYDKKAQDENKINHDSVEIAGKVLKGLELVGLADQNQEIGEQLGRTPCMAIQGHNGAEGEVASPFYELDQAILGGQQQNSISR